MIYDIFRILLAALGGGALIYVGIVLLRILSQKTPDPPPVGELRKVQLNYHCTICATELQIKVAPVDDPDPPKHCGEEMNLQAPLTDGE